MAKKSEAEKMFDKYVKAISTANQRLGRLYKGGYTESYAYSTNETLVGTKPFVTKTKAGVVRFATPNEFSKLSAEQQKEAVQWVGKFNKLESSTVRGAKRAENRSLELLKKKATKNSFLKEGVTGRDVNMFWKTFREVARDTADVIYEEIKDVVEHSNIISLSETEQAKIIKEFVRFANKDYDIEAALKKHTELEWSE